MSADTQSSPIPFVIGISPFARPDARLVSAVSRAGGLGVLDLGSEERDATAALALLAQWAPDGFGVRVGADCPLSTAEIATLTNGGLRVVVLPAEAVSRSAEWLSNVTVVAEVTHLDEALAASEAGVSALIARGREAGGRVGDLSTFILLQQLLSDPRLTTPIWAAGGIGEHTAAAAVLGGAAGVVLDTALALLPESDLPAALAAVLRRTDGSDTIVGDGIRYLPSRLGAPSLTVGEDAFLASRFAARYDSVGAAVRAMTAAILAATDATAQPVAIELGSELPIAQGPMTRVSDQPAFAAEVAKAGALPFLALALCTGEQTRSMMHQTRDAISDRAWGVGILGFAPEEVRSAQLEVVREIRPTHAIIAGGRPAQALDLEKLGISTFLHVPSPGLLSQFLAAGARKFIFEGSECGGHVGPRASFPLWEAQLCVIADYLAEHGPTELELLFAGGIHDARSAAMVGALTTTLAGSGVRTGVLMGTSYLFTEEAVAHGAVVPTFQSEVVAAESTSLIETAPGHAIRSLSSQFVTDFETTKSELVASGLAAREIWAQLEDLNVGRLRIASKGLRRDGNAIVSVDDAAQRDEGLYMAGQVVVLRNAVTTIADLHDDVVSGAAEFRQQRVAQLSTQRTLPNEPMKPVPADIAIVGMDCMFPNSPDLASFWATILDGVDAVTEVPSNRWDAGTYFDPTSTGTNAGAKSPSRWGGFLPPIAFDPLRYGIPPAALGSIDPSQLLALEVSRRALVDAGYDRPGVDHDRTSVIFGAEAGSDLSNATVLRNLLPSYLSELPAELDEQLPHLTEDSFPGVLANVISGRIANRLDLGGANYTVDAACGSALAAVDASCRLLNDGSSDLVLCGAADLHNGIHDYLMFSSAHALSPTGRSRTFDSAADGIALGEGVACVVLKRLADAERDGDRIYGVIAGVGAGSDGKALGLTAPRPDGQRRALDRAYATAGISPAEVGLVEAHGTGTVVGDRTELATLTTLFTDHAAAAGSCVIGSVKSQIGHTKCAAGLAGLIKATMAVYTGVRPPTLGLSDPNQSWHADTSPFAFNTAATPWVTPQADRTAGVSAFGFGGTNFHVVVRGRAQGADLRHGRDQWPAELFTFRATDQAAAYRELDWLIELTATNDRAGRPWRLRDLAATASHRAESRSAPVQIALVAADLDELASQLTRARAGEHDPVAGIHQKTASFAAAGSKLAYLFPGQGSQGPGMLAELFVTFPELQHYLRLADSHAGIMFPPAAFDADAQRAQQDAIRDTRLAQPTMGLAGLAVNHLLHRLGLSPDMVGGHSYGELVALHSAGVFTAAGLLELSDARAAAILAAAGDDPGSMAAVSAPSDEVSALLAEAGLAGRVVTANQNAPRQTVISGPSADVATAVESLRAAGLGAKPIPVACAFHSPVVADGAIAFGTALDQQALHEPRVQVWSNRTAAPYGDVRADLTGQIGSPVRFVDQIEAMYAAGARVFVEAGPGQVITRLVKAILGDREHLAVAIEPRTAAGLPGLLGSLATLATAGVLLSTSWFFSGRDAVDVSVAKPPKRPGWLVDGQLVRTLDGRPVAGGLVPARRISAPLNAGPLNAAPSALEGDSSMTSAATERENLLAEYLRTSRELIAAQRDVMLGFIAAGGSAPSGGWQLVPSAPAQVAANGQIAAAVSAPNPVQSPSAELATVVAASEAPVEPSRGTPADLAIEQAVLGIISERTGYPADMIELDLDLEADLSIDSIKRTEIVGELAPRLGLTATDLAETDLEELSQARTTRAIVSWLEAKLNAAAAGAPADAPLRPALVKLDTTNPAAAPAIDLEQAVLGIISERTGYPADMIELDLDLEADLSIDSIKRTEIVGELAPRLGLTATDLGETDLEELSQARTARAIVSWLEAKLRPAPQLAMTDTPAADTPAFEEPRSATPGIAPKRLQWQQIHLGVPAGNTDLTGTSVVVLGEDGVETATLQAQLEHAGATVTRTLETADVDGVFVLAGWSDQAAGDGLPELIAPIKDALTRPLRWLVAAAPATAGLRGCFRSLQREYPEVLIRLVELSSDAAAADIATAAIGELSDPRQLPVVVVDNAERTSLETVEVPLQLLSHSSAGFDEDDSAAAVRELGLTRDSVVVLVGGARGITAGFAAALARTSQCRIELIGRTELPCAAESDELASATDAAGLRAALIAGGLRDLPEIERIISTTLAQREVRSTISRLTDLGSRVGYTAVDVRSSEEVHRVIKQISIEQGRIDGVVYAAGVIEDKLLKDKNLDSFRRVYSTKVDGAEAVLSALGELSDKPGFVVLFGSIAAVFGNRGQVDYAAANDALAHLGAQWSSQTGSRCLTVHWGPWAPSDEHGGMVSAELAHTYAERGLSLLDPVEGVRSLFRELAWGDPATTEVTYTASGW